ncbi:uncharacterized protein LOC127787497 [Diospyros lotus]|uniref:uncharacterized protein LOC127787497 n=1 Tax=Diospyros lotus TaxID=55363 RepID=UPI00225A13EE|nr:uncharacterized protein LOC127787497 [Diospyros lotus]
MALSKEWMNLVNDRLNEAYQIGVQKFLDYALKKLGAKNKIRCPCTKCCNTDLGTRESIEAHLMIHGISEGYTFWYHHGELNNEPQSESEDEENEILQYDTSAPDDSDDEIQQFINDLYPQFKGLDENNEDVEFPNTQNLPEMEPNNGAKQFYKLIDDLEQPIYPGSLVSRLSAILKLLHIKSLGRWSNKSFTMLLQLLKELLPEGSFLPDSYYNAKKVLHDIGLSYEKYDSCVNDCMLYWKTDNGCDCCKVCGASRWKKDYRNGEFKMKTNGKKIPIKTLRYFPLKPRLQRLFMSSKSASSMRWHFDKRVDDGVIRHPTDSMAWKDFDKVHPNFSSEPRNVRLGLASDGFQPFSNSRTPYSIWPVVLIPYNVEPWVCMKPSNFLLSMLIPGLDGPGDAIDTYLQPLIDELNELWELGVETFDVSTRQNFTMHVALMWTINDFPAYGILSGWSTKGKLACPCCNKNTFSTRLTNGGKQCYMGHRRYLPMNHKWRNNRVSFDGTRERGVAPNLLSGVDVLKQVQDLEGITLTKSRQLKTKINHENRGDNWNKKSIFFKLPYWSTLLLRHNLDVMHIEKNICDNILGTIMNVKGKTKDNLKSRLDLKSMGIRPELHPIVQGDKVLLPLASYVLSPKEKDAFLIFLKKLRVPDGFSSNISQCVNLKDHKIIDLKSHDCHVLIQHILPIALRGIVPNDVCEALTELSLFFKILSGKALRVKEIEQIESQIFVTLCKLEMIFPPSFFNVMEHLSIHLPNEVKVGGPIQYRWMYPMERYLYNLKSFVRNKTHLEGSIAEGYIASECMMLCSRYLHSIETKFNRLDRNYEGDVHNGGSLVFNQRGRLLGAGITRDLENNEWIEAHIYILRNCSKVQPFIE